MGNKYASIMMLVCICMLTLSACATGTASNSTSSSMLSTTNSGEDTASPNISKEDSEDHETKLLTGYLGASTYTTTNEGFYQVVSNPKGGCNIFYTDYSSNETVYLCSQANCLHNDDTCSSWFPTTTLQLFSSLDHDEIYYIESSKKGDQLWSMGRTGKDRQLLFQCSASERILDAIAENEKYLYFSVTSINVENGTQYKQLLQLDITTGKTSKLLEFPVQTWLFGAYNNTLLILYYDEPAFTYRTYDLHTQELNDVYSYNVDSDGQGAFARPYADELYIFEPSGENKAILSKMNIETHESKPLISNIEYWGANFISVSGFYDNYMSVFITNPSDYSQTHYLIDWEAGEIYPINLEYPQGDISVSVDIYAVANERFVVNCGIKSQDIVLQNNDGSTYASQVDFMEYGLIKEMDYINNTFNVTRISWPQTNSSTSN